MKNEYIYVPAALLALAVFMAVSSISAAAPTVDSTFSIPVNVTVQQVTWIDIFPENVTWANLYPGSYGTVTDLTIESMGSVNVTYIWFNVTQPTSNPFGSGDPNKYDAGNYVVLLNTTQSGNTVTQPYFIDMLEYGNDSQMGDKPAYLTLGSNIHRWGRFRIANHEFFWGLIDDGGVCNTSSSKLVISKIVHNESSNDYITVADGAANTVTLNIAGAQNTWGYTNLTNFNSADSIYPNDLNYCVAVAGDCSKVRFFRWNAEAPGATGSGATIICPHFTYFVDSSNPLTPGKVKNARINVMLPYGVPYGQIKEGTLTVVASTV